MRIPFALAAMALFLGAAMAEEATPATTNDFTLRRSRRSLQREERRSRRDDNSTTTSSSSESKPNASPDEAYQMCRDCFEDTFSKFCYDDNECVGLFDSCDDYSLTRSSCSNKRKCLDCSKKEGYYWCSSNKKCQKEERRCSFEALFPDDC